MKKSELRQIIREEIGRLNEATSKYDGMKVRAHGVFAKGLKDGKTYTLNDAAPHMGEVTYNFMLGSKIAARFPESSISRFLRNVAQGDLNGLEKL